MIYIKIDRDDKEENGVGEIKIMGDQNDVENEMMFLGEQIATQNKHLAELLMLGIMKSENFTMEELQRTLKAGFTSIELAKMIKTFRKTDEKLEKNDEKSNKTIDKRAKKTENIDKEDKKPSELFELSSLLDGIINLLGDKKDE